eukprot:1143696-Pelagomonas_calceolata.AAC.5
MQKTGNFRPQITPSGNLRNTRPTQLHHHHHHHHHLCTTYLVLDVHLVKLIDATDAVVRQHERTRLNSKLIVLRLFHHRCCQASSSGGLAGGIHSSGQEAGHIPACIRLRVGAWRSSREGSCVGRGA